MLLGAGTRQGEEEERSTHDSENRQKSLLENSKEYKNKMENWNTANGKRSNTNNGRYWKREDGKKDVRSTGDSCRCKIHVTMKERRKENWNLEKGGTRRGGRNWVEAERRSEGKREMNIRH